VQKKGRIVQLQLMPIRICTTRSELRRIGVKNDQTA
jgi:hypothetical protein